MYEFIAKYYSKYITNKQNSSNFLRQGQNSLFIVHLTPLTTENRRKPVELIKIYFKIKFKNKKRAIFFQAHTSKSLLVKTGRNRARPTRAHNQSPPSIFDPVVRDDVVFSSLGSLLSTRPLLFAVLFLPPSHPSLSPPR